MNDKRFIHRAPARPGLAAGILRRLTQILIVITIEMGVFFLASGRPGWVMAWVYIGVYLAFVAINAAVLLSKDPELIVERGEVKSDAKSWDKLPALVVSFLGPLIGFLVAGLDVRLGWGPRPASWVSWAALVAVVLGYGLWGWAMAANKFFSGMVRIQTDRGHSVASSGPYRTVRHPGYAGLIVFTLATPLMLGSLWALVPAGLTVGVAVMRTALEDRTLQDELDGYKDYARQVRYRLLPGIW